MLDFIFPRFFTLFPLVPWDLLICGQKKFRSSRLKIAQIKNQYLCDPISFKR